MNNTTVITLGIHKGGAGKSSICANLSYALKLRKKMDFSEIKECFEEDDDTEYVHLLIRVPLSIKDDVRAMIDEMIKKTR